MPTRGKARKIGVRVDSRPVASARQNGELARQREQHRQVHAHPVGDVDGLVGVVDADVDVHPEDQLLARDEAQRGDQVAVARARDDPLVLPHRERVRARRADRQPALGGRARAPGRAARAAGRRPRAVSAQGVVAISSTDSISSGLTSPVGGPRSSSVSIALTSSSVSASTIISSSSMPSV